MRLDKKQQKKPHTFIFSLRFSWSSVCLSAVLAAVYLSTCLFIFTFPPSHHFILTFVPPLISHPLVFLSSKFLLSNHFLSSLSFFFFPHLFCLPSSLSLSYILSPLLSANPLGCGTAFLPGFSGSGFVRETPVSPPPHHPRFNGRLEPCFSVKSTDTQSHRGALQAGTGVRWSKGKRLNIRQKKWDWGTEV